MQRNTTAQDLKPLDGIDLDATLVPLLVAERATVEAWLRDEPGSWGALAGRAVLAARQALGRRLTDTERRIVWQALWDRLVRVRNDERGTRNGW